VAKAKEMTLVLGIETSCDETAAAVVEDGRRILSNVVASQIELHRRYGGVFPEVASRQHVLAIIPVVEKAMKEAEASWEEIDAIAVTYGPGLAGSLLVGVNAAKGLAFGFGLPFIGVNHIEAHLYTNWLISEEIAFPLICLVVSGGHTELILMKDHGVYERLGGTLDDAAGEAFDKVGRLLGMEYPGGPAIERAAKYGDPNSFDLPRAWLKGTYNFSFSGLKTAVLRTFRKQRTCSKIRQTLIADLAASFQAAVVDVLVEKTKKAAEEHGARMILLAGGVAANRVLDSEMRSRAKVPVLCPPPHLCTDNATGVAVVGFFSLKSGRISGWDLDVIPNLKLT
jgi:N6-L-threonylcarbamoyladenine synthase